MYLFLLQLSHAMCPPHQVMDNVTTMGGTMVIVSPSAATLATFWQEVAPGPVSPMDSGQAHNHHASVSIELACNVHSITPTACSLFAYAAWQSSREQVQENPLYMRLLIHCTHGLVYSSWFSWCTYMKWKWSPGSNFLALNSSSGANLTGDSWPLIFFLSSVIMLLTHGDQIQSHSQGYTH